VSRDHEGKEAEKRIERRLRIKMPRKQRIAKEKDKQKIQAAQGCSSISTFFTR